MTHLDAVFDILERHHSVSDLVLAGNRLPWWKDVLQNLHNTLTEPRCEAIENQMWVGFTNTAPNAPRYVVAQDNIV